MKVMRSLHSFLLFCLIGSSVGAFGQMTPNAPVKDFRFPRFGENGYTQWVLQGEQGIYESEEQIRVSGMVLRLYSGDERMALELSLDSPEATLRLQENRAFSEEAIQIVGTNFTISGIGWEWWGESKEIVVKKDTRVEFSQGIATAFSGKEVAEGRETEINSERLLLRTTDAAYYFQFAGGVEAMTETMQLESEQLIVFADPPDGRDTSQSVPVTTAPSELDSIRQILAEGNVMIRLEGRIIAADEAEFYPRESRAFLKGNASVLAPGAYLSGETIQSQTGEIAISGLAGGARAQMILSNAGGLGLGDGASLSAETIVLADLITMREEAGENRFFFDGGVEVMSGGLKLRASRMQIVAVAGKAAEDLGVEGGLDVGEVREIVAEGSVEIEQNDQLAAGERVIFYPADQRAVLTGDPRVITAEAKVTGESMEFQPGVAIVRGAREKPLVVTLPQLPDLGYEPGALLGGPRGGPESRGERGKAPLGGISEETVITSQFLRMEDLEARRQFIFTGDVRVSGTNLEASSRRLEVIALEKSGGVDDSVSVGAQLERIEALEDVVIRQSGRESTAKKALILPVEGKVVLEGDAVVEDERGRVSGSRITLLQGEGRAIVDGAGDGDGRARITLPAPRSRE